MTRKPGIDTNRRSTRSIIVRNLSAGYRGMTIVNRASLELRTGELVGLVGHNGSGKSTMLLGIMGLIDHHSDVLQINGRNCAGRPTRERKQAGLAIMLQREAIFPGLDIATNLRLAGGAVLQTSLEPYPRVHAMTQALLKRRGMIAASLSGGERRMLGLLMTLYGAPSFLLVDEPTLGLSNDLEAEIFTLLRDLTEQDGMGTLLVSHNLDQVQRNCQRAYIIEEGRIDESISCGSDGPDLRALLHPHSVSFRRRGVVA